MAVERALDWYIGTVPETGAPLSRGEAESLRALLAGRRDRAVRDFELLAAFAWTIQKLAELGAVPPCNLGDALTALAQVESPEPPFAYETAVDPGTFAKLKFRDTSLGIVRAQRDHREGWWAHGQRNRAYINEAASRTGGTGLAVVLGAGQAFDLPLDALARRFDRLVLVDIDGQALEETVSGVLPDPGLRARVELRVMDLTGINRALIERLEALLGGPPGDALDGLERLCHGYRLAPPPRLLPEGERADLLVSSCVLSQLAWPQRLLAERLHEQRFGPVRGPVEERWVRMWAELELKVQQDHFTALAGTAEVIALTTDVLSHVTVLEAGIERPSGEIVHALGAPALGHRIPRFFEAADHQGWAWPRYKATARAEGSLMSVEAVVLRERA